MSLLILFPVSGGPVVQTVHLQAAASLTGVSIVLRSQDTGVIVDTSAASEILPGSGVYSAAFTDIPAATYFVQLVRDSDGAILRYSDLTLSLVEGFYAVSGGGNLVTSESGGGGGGLTAPQAAQLIAIEAHASLITSGTRITVAADGGSSITLKAGDDYLESISTAKRIEITDAASTLYTLFNDADTITIAFGAGMGPKKDIVTGTVAKGTITHTAAVGAVPAYTTIFVETTVSDSLTAFVGEYDIQITHANGKKQTVFSGVCTVTNDFKS